MMHHDQTRPAPDPGPRPRRRPPGQPARPNPTCDAIRYLPLGAAAGVTALARGLKRAWRVIALVLAAVPGLAAAQPGMLAEGWTSQPPEFRAGTSGERAPTVLYFTATWCGYCRQMERTTLDNARVLSRLEPFWRVKLDYDRQPELVARYQIQGVPAFVMVDARGEEITRLVGMAEPEPFCDWLQAGQARAVEVAKAAQQRQAELSQLAERLESKEPGGWEETKARLYELAARGETESRAFALRQLTAHADKAPGALFDGLLHPDLAVRITVAGVLRKKLGEHFEFDPWAEASARELAVSRLRDPPSR